MKEILLGKKTPLPPRRAPEILYPIPRSKGPRQIFGFDHWRDYEMTWLNPDGKPEVAILEIIYPAATGFIIESKSMKLYLGSLANEKFEAGQALLSTIRNDLGNALQSSQIDLHLTATAAPAKQPWPAIAAISIDDLEIATDIYLPEPGLLETGPESCQERLMSDLLMSFCPITHQPDWGSVIVEYEGPRIVRQSLLKYIISYRNHAGFAESCCESIYNDIMDKCRPDRLKVICLYTRRGGIDINPVRTSEPVDGSPVPRTIRQ